MKAKKVTVHYVDNKKFYDEILKYRESVEEAKKLGKIEPRLPEYIGECIYKIAQKLSTMPRFVNYSYRDEMISDGIENCIMYFKDYNPEIGQNPFAYFTQIIYYAFLRRIGKEEKNRYIIYKNFQHTIIHGPQLSEHDLTGSTDNIVAANLYDAHDDVSFTPKMYDNINEFMEKFEKREEEKKVKRKQTKEGLQKFYEEEEDNEQRSAISN